MTFAGSEFSQVQVRSPLDSDYGRWSVLYRGYAEFYGVAQTDTARDVVWSWIHDPNHEVGCLLADSTQDGVVGLAHFRPFARPLRSSTGCFLDDLFVDPHARGVGAADALLTALRRLAVAKGWDLVRWITADDNYRARAKYDQYATRTPWITYDLTPE